MTEPTVAEVERLRAELIHDRDKCGWDTADSRLYMALCDHWLAAHRSTPATAGTLSADDAELCRDLRWYSPENREHIVHKAAARIEALSARAEALERALRKARATLDTWTPNRARGIMDAALAAQEPKP